MLSLWYEAKLGGTSQSDGATTVTFNTHLAPRMLLVRLSRVDYVSVSGRVSRTMEIRRDGRSFFAHGLGQSAEGAVE